MLLTRPGQGITQQDVALSLYEVLTCPWGGMPDEFMIDNGGEFGFLAESVIRFAAMAGISGLGVVKCRPYHPEGKARIEGAFRVLEAGFISALLGYNGGNILKPRLKSCGKAVAPYDRGPDRLIADLHLAVAQYNGTVQHGDLAGLSPKAMLGAKAEATGWQAQQITDSDMFDLVFSREERRDVRQGTVTIGKRRYSGPALAELIGEKQVPVLVPWRDPDGSIILFRDGVIHRLTGEIFALNDREGAVRKSEMVRRQKAEIARRKATVAEVDVQQMLSNAADLEPIQRNAPAEWSFAAIDKGGFIGAPISEEEARAGGTPKTAKILTNSSPFQGREDERLAAATARPLLRNVTIEKGRHTWELNLSSKRAWGQRCPSSAIMSLQEVARAWAAPEHSHSWGWFPHGGSVPARSGRVRSRVPMARG